MFTGIIEEVGVIEKTSTEGGNLKLRIKASNTLTDLKVGYSMNINGACQTVIERGLDSFTVEATEETLRRTNLGQLKRHDRVNLERSLRFSDRLGGHLVTGHVDCVGRIRSATQREGSILYEFELPQKYLTYLVEKGSVAVDGISLTVVELKEKTFTVAVIPFTLKNTSLGKRKRGDLVNVETDVIGKYVERTLASKRDKPEITEEWLKNKGW